MSLSVFLLPHSETHSTSIPASSEGLQLLFLPISGPFLFWCGFRPYHFNGYPGAHTISPTCILKCDTWTLDSGWCLMGIVSNTVSWQCRPPSSRWIMLLGNTMAQISTPAVISLPLSMLFSAAIAQNAEKLYFSDFLPTGLLASQLEAVIRYQKCINVIEAICLHAVFGCFLLPGIFINSAYNPSNLMGIERLQPLRQLCFPYSIQAVTQSFLLLRLQLRSNLRSSLFQC